MKRGIGDVVAVIVIVGVAVALSIVASIIITNTARLSEPKGSVLSVQGVRAIPLRSDYSRLMIEIVATVHGTSSIRYGGITVRDPNGNAMSTCQLDSPNTDTVFNPGQTFTITATCSSSSGGSWAYRQVVVEVSYIDLSTNRAQLARGTGTILPYS